MKFKWDHKYLHIGITAFLVIAASLLLYALLLHTDAVGGAILAAWNALSPVTYGLVIAYLLWPICKLTERKWFLPLSMRLSSKKPQRCRRRARVMSVTFAVVLALALVTGLLWLVLPQLLESLQSLVSRVPQYFNEVSLWLNNVLVDYPDLQQMVSEHIGDFSTSLTKFIDSVIPQISGVLTSISSGVLAVFGTLFNLFMGLVISVYLLSRKEKFLAQTKKVLYALLPPQTANRLLKNGALTHRKFGGFITAKITDSILISLIAYPCLLILQMPYAALCAVIIGVCNIIPIFGPIIGAVPCAFLALMDGPIKCLVFIVFIVLLQQIDANIIGPKLLSENIGINGFWVIVSLLLGQWLFGVTGMIVAVPIFAVMYTLIRGFCEKKLRERELPVETVKYERLSRIDPLTHEPSYQKEAPPDSTAAIFKKLFKGKKKGNTKSE